MVAFEYTFKILVGSIIGYFMWKLKDIEKKANSSLTREQVREVIKDMQKPLEVRLEELKDDSKRVESKIDRIMDKIITP